MKGTIMRLTVICGLDHIEPENRTSEAARLLTELAEQIRAYDEVRDKDMLILRDINGNRVGVCDITER